MSHKPTQPDFNELEITAMLDALAPVMPALERLVEVWRQRESEANTLELEDFIDISESYLQRLPGIYQGRSRHENLTGFYEDTLREVENRRHCDVFAEYEACHEIFTPEQWEVIYLYWNQGLTQTDIAKTLGLKRSAVSGRLARAETRKEHHDKRMRQEQLDHLRKMQKERYE